LDQIVWLIGGTHLRMILSTLATIAVHVALILFLLYRLSDVGPGPAKADGDRITLIDIGDSEAQDKVAPKVEQPAADVAAPEAEQQQPSDEITAPPAPEWAMVKMRVAHKDEAKSAPATAAAPPAAPKMASGGSSGYDPYAGAAPQWRDPPPVWTARATTTIGTAASDVRLASPVVATIRHMFDMAGIRTSAPLRLRITVDGEGRVASVAFAPEVTDRVMPPSIALMLRGKRLACFIGMQDCAAGGLSVSSVDVVV
jgi:hypothetical protein